MTNRAQDIFLDLPALSKRSCLSVSTLRGHIRSGDLTAYKPGGKVLVSWKEFTQWMESHRISDIDINAIVAELEGV